MTITEWLTKYNLIVQLKPKGFNIENAQGDARYAQIIEGSRYTRFVNYSDVYDWLKKNINDTVFFSWAAINDFAKVVKP